MKISASIVVYNEDKEILQRVISSFLGITFDKELIVVDNSPKRKLDSFCENFHNIRYIFNNGKNIGFGAGHNLAFKKLQIKSDIHLIINPDIYFDSQEMTNFLQWFIKEKDFALAIPNILNLNGSIQQVVRNIPTPFTLIKRRLGILKDEIIIKKNSINEIPFAHGCFLACKTEVYEKLHGFDERLFMYMEDVDIWIRAKKYGKTVINTNFLVYHEYRKGSSKSFKLLFFHIVSAFKFFLSSTYLKKNNF